MQSLVTALSHPSPQIAPYYHGLDAFRCVLFIMILYAHCVLDPEVVARQGIEMMVYQIAWSGVQGFFVLSAFIITNLLLHERKTTDHIDIKDFYRRRVLKILPPVLALIGILFWLIHLDCLTDPRAWNALPRLNSAAYQDAWTSLPWFLVLIGNNLYAFGLIAPLFPALLILWTLCVEEQFYLIHPFIVRHFSARLYSSQMLKNIALLIGLILVLRCILYAGLWWSGYDRLVQWRIGYTFSLLQVDSLLVGVWIALVLHRGRQERNGLKIAAIALIGFCIWGYMWAHRTMGSEPVLMSLINVVFGGLVLGLARAEHNVRRFKLVQIMARIGRNGYCLYLIHHLALLTAFNLLVDAPWFAALNGTLRFWLRLALAFTLALIMAKALYLTAERPFRAYRHRAL
jgi:peptidoglycan/LPS O-acetylase OafA/YrhL